MHRLLAALSGFALVSGLFLGAPAPVYAVDGDSVIDVGRIKSNDSDIIQEADELESNGKYQVYLAEASDVVTLKLRLTSDDFSKDDGIVDSFTIALNNGSFGADYTANRTTNGTCDLAWTNTSTTLREGAIDCDDSGEKVHNIRVDFDLTMPAAGPVVLTVTGAGSTFKVYFFVAESADTIYVGSGTMTTGAGSCTNPDFSTTDADQGFEDQEAIDAALQAIDQETDTVVICNGTYTYTSDIRYYDGDDFSTGLVTVEAQTAGSVTLDGDDNHQLLRLEDVSASISGIEFYDGYSSGDGGAIRLSDGDLTIDNSVFDSNYADDDGGAISLTEGAIDVSDSTFTDNFADGDHGGAIHVKYDLVQDVDNYITDSTFTGNESDYMGGAVLVQNDDDDDDDVPVYLNITGSTFEDNATSSRGGAVRSGHQVMLSVDDSTFTENYTENGDGGAISAMDDATIGFSVFTRNQAGDDGGAIYFDETADINDSRFVSNFADGEGGAVYAETMTYVDDTIFLRNRSLGWAGALSLAGNAWLDGAIFRANKSRRGGAIDSWGDRLYLTESRFFNNRATRDGGAIIRDGETLFGDVGPDTIFRGNQARLGDSVAFYRWKVVDGGPGRATARTWSRVWVAAGTTVWLVR